MTIPSKVREILILGCIDRTSEVPIIPHFDSLGLHDSSNIGNNVQKFFNFAWKQLFKRDNFMFYKTNHPVVCPKGKMLQAVCQVHMHHLCFSFLLLFTF